MAKSELTPQEIGRGPLEIHFGDVFRYTFEGQTREYVVTGTGEDSYFIAAQIMIEKNGAKRLGLPGTSFKENVHGMTGERWTLEQVIEAYKVDFTFSEEFYRIVRKRSQEPPRLIF